MDRRGALRFTAFAGLAACTACQQAVHEAHETPHWTYAGHGGPDEWGSLAPDYAVCGSGAEQSPIDLAGALRSELSDIAVDWRTIPLVVAHNGHTIQVDTAGAGSSMIDGTSYELVQFHFHHPSEHTKEGRPYPMELHLVHKAANGGLAVLGVFMTPGAAQATIAQIWAAMPREEGVNRPSATIDPATLLPSARPYYRYAGSLTTPPCSETVLWSVFAEPIEVSQAQIDAFAALFPGNARPLQNRNRRFLLTRL